MKKLVALLSICLFSWNLYSQVYSTNFRTFDTNGPMGECLFDTVEHGEIMFQNVVIIDKTKSELREKAIRFFEEIDNSDVYDVSAREKNMESYVKYDVNISSGRMRDNAGFVSWERDVSTVRCHVTVEFKDGRYRYIVNPYETNRMTIRGEAKSDGRPNEIHWQRVNSLTKERAKYKVGKKKYEEYTAQINFENECYRAEYNAVQEFVRRLSSYYETTDKEADF